MKTMSSSSATESLPLYISASARAGGSSMPASVAGGVVALAGNSTSTSTSSSASATPTTSSTTTAPSPAGSTGAGVALKGAMGGLVGVAAVLASFALA